LSPSGLPMPTLEEALRLADIPMSAAEAEGWARMAADRQAREERMARRRLDSEGGLVSTRLLCA
jgi:hypothetical protein